MINSQQSSVGGSHSTVASQPAFVGSRPDNADSYDRQPATDRRTGTILIADDQPDVLEALRLLLKGEGYRIEQAGSPAAILDAIESADFDAVLMDLNYARDTTSGREGLDLLTQLRTHDATLPVVVMTAWGSVDVAVEAMRRGARDFVQKPWENARLLSILRTQVELARALRRQQRLEAENRSLKPDVRPMLIAEAPTMRPVLELIARVGPSEANVLVTGENGTGKGTVAQAIHSVSSRAGKGLVTVNAGGLSEGVFESELFGHVKGAFTDAKADRVGRFELADGGTLFLDEIANVPLNLQPKLLRVLETGDFERVGSSRTRHVNVRIVSATNANLAEEVAASRFRQDLLFRLNTIEIQLPPLRERREDIPALAMHFLRQHTQRYRKTLTGFEQAALQALVDHPWPGNIRELDHAVERGVLMARTTTIRLGDLGLRLDRDSTSRVEEMSLEEVEGFLIKKAMARFGGNVSQAAKTLGLSRSALYRRLQRYGL
jgi:DNA-binding NtrC family response regulator